MRRFIALFIFGISFLLFGCVSSKTKDSGLESVVAIPKWITDRGRLELFPSNLYISQLAYGNTAQESKEKASANISGYIKSTVESATTSSYFYKESSNSVVENKESKEYISISADNNLYKIEYTNPFYYSDLGQFACVAYINKDQAFNYVKPKLENAKINFPQAYQIALNKDSLLERIKGIKNAQKILTDFYEVYDFARAINPIKTKAYESVDLLAKESFLKINDLSSEVLVTIIGKGDRDLLESSGIVAEISNQFTKLGFVVSSSNKSNCIAFVEVKSLITETANTYETYPELYVTLLENGKEQISYARKLTKVAGFNKDTVIRRTKIALINEIRTSFVDGFN